jgi:methylenetetrahydrofolate reductase (NADPH)
MRALEPCGDDEAAVLVAGVKYATEQCRELLSEGVDGIHYYTLNKSQATREIYAALGMRGLDAEAK